MREIGETSVFALAGEDGVAARLPQHLPPPRLAPGRGGRGPGPPPHPVPVPRLVVRARRQPRRRAAHGRGRGLRPLVLWPDRGQKRRRLGPPLRRSERRGARSRSSTSATSATRLAGWRLSDLRRAGSRDVRGRGELEGDRRELQRVPPLPRRPPGAERALRLPERQLAVRAGRLVRRLDGAERGRRDDGPERPRAAPADHRARPGRARVRLLLRALSRTRSSRSTPTT